MIEIKISGNTPLEALASLTAFGLRCMGNEEVCAAANRILEAERAKEHKEASKVSKSNTTTTSAVTADTELSATPSTSAVAANTELSAAAGKTTTPAKSDSVADLPPEPYVEEPPHGDPAPAPGPKPEEQPTPPTLVEVRAKGMEVARKHGRAAVEALLKDFHVENITALAEGDRAAFLVKLEELEEQGDGNA